MIRATGLRLASLRPWRRRAARGPLTVVEHLSELRRRLVVAAVGFLIMSVAAFFLYDLLLAAVRRPLCSLDPDLLGPQGCNLVFVKVTGGFMFRLKLTAMAGILTSAPIWLYQVFAFVTPALTKKEKRYAVPFLLSAVVLLVIGGAVAYLSLPTGLKLLMTIGGEGLSPFLGAEEYLNFVGLMMIGFSAMFELPLLLFFLGLAGVISVKHLRSQRKVALVAIVALSALVTPSQDPYTLLVLAGPLYLLYELTIVLLWFTFRRRKRVAVHR